MPTQKKYMDQKKVLNTKKAHLHKDKKNQCQQLTETQRNELLKLLQKFKYLFNVTLSTWIIYQIDFELKEGANPIE